MKKASLLPLILIVFIDLLGVNLAIPVVAPMIMNGEFLPGMGMQARTILIGFLLASYPLAQFFGAPILGALSDRYGRKKVLIISLAGSFIGYIIFGVGIFAKNIFLLFFSRILDGFTGGNISTVMSAIADISEDSEKTRNFGLVGMAFGIGLVIGPFVGGKLADPGLVPWFNYATPFWFSAALVAINLAMVAFLFRETLAKSRKTEISPLTGMRNIRKALMLSHLRIMFIVVFLLTFSFNFYTQFFSVYLIERFHFTTSQIGNFFAYSGLWIAIGQGFVTRPLSRIFSPAQVLSFSTLVRGIALILLLAPADPFMFFFILPFVSVAQGLTQPNSTAIVSNLSARDSQGEILGINQSVQSLAMSIPPIIAGFIAVVHMTLPIIVSSAVTFAGWAVFVLFFSKRKEPLFVEA